MHRFFARRLNSFLLVDRNVGYAAWLLRPQALGTSAQNDTSNDGMYIPTSQRPPRSNISQTVHKLFPPDEEVGTPSTRDIIEAAKTTTKPVYVVWGAPAGTDDTYYKRLLDGGLPVFRTFHNCVAAVKSYADYWAFSARYSKLTTDGYRDQSWVDMWNYYMCLSHFGESSRWRLVLFGGVAAG